MPPHMTQLPYFIFFCLRIFFPQKVLIQKPPQKEKNTNHPSARPNPNREKTRISLESLTLPEKYSPDVGDCCTWLKRTREHLEYFGMLEVVGKELNQCWHLEKRMQKQYDQHLQARISPCFWKKKYIL